MSPRSCPVCGHAAETLLHPQLNSNDVDTVICIIEHVPDWSESAGICSACLVHFASRAQQNSIV
jgi:hypothetical protein